LCSRARRRWRLRCCRGWPVRAAAEADLGQSAALGAPTCGATGRFEKWGALKGENSAGFASKPYLRFDEKLWRDLLQAMRRGGLNSFVIDLGDAVAYRSHPEIAVKNAWSPRKLREKPALPRPGLEPIPKLNFSTPTTPGWASMNAWSSTPDYYASAAN